MVPNSSSPHCAALRKSGWELCHAAECPSAAHVASSRSPSCFQVRSLACSPRLRSLPHLGSGPLCQGTPTLGVGCRSRHLLLAAVAVAVAVACNIFSARLPYVPQAPSPAHGGARSRAVPVDLQLLHSQAGCQHFVLLPVYQVRLSYCQQLRASTLLQPAPEQYRAGTKSKIRGLLPGRAGYKKRMMCRVSW